MFLGTITLSLKHKVAFFIFFTFCLVMSYSTSPGILASPATHYAPSLSPEISARHCCKKKKKKGQAGKGQPQSGNGVHLSSPVGYF